MHSLVLTISLALAQADTAEGTPCFATMTDSRQALYLCSLLQPTGLWSWRMICKITPPSPVICLSVQLAEIRLARYLQEPWLSRSAPTGQPAKNSFKLHVWSDIAFSLFL